MMIRIGLLVYVLHLATFVNGQQHDVQYADSSSILLNSVNITGRSATARIQELEALEAEINTKNGIYYRGRPPIWLLNPFSGKPITFFYELLSKGGKRARKMRSQLQEQILESKIDQIFNASTIQAQVSVPREDINTFLFLYRPSYDQVKNWTKYDLMLYIKSKYQEFINQKYINNKSIPKLPDEP